MKNDDMIEKLAFELFEKSHEPPFSDDAQGFEEARVWAQKIATDLLPTRDEIKKVLQREFGSFLAHNPANPARFWGQSADAVLDLLKGEEA